jgi:signal transduction histidine kinase
VWFRRRFRLPAPQSAIRGEAPALEFIRYFEAALERPTASAELQAALARFHVSPPIKQERDLPALYLLLESALAAGADTPMKVRREALRVIAAYFAPLLSRHDFALIFVAPGVQERLLCQDLLSRALAQAIALLGAAGNDFLRALSTWITAAPHASLPIPFELRATVPVHDSEWVALFFRLARELYIYLETKLGESCARSFFERGYDDLAHRYALLDTFPVVVHLLPERLLDSEKLGRLSRGQIQNVLLQKVGELNDINAQLQAQYCELDATKNQLVAVRDDLERRVEARTAELRVANEGLLAAKEKAELADRAKSEFLANMSHELRTPLNAVIGFSEVLRDAIMGPLDIRYRHYAADIHSAGRHLLDVIGDILDLSKIEVGRLDLRDEVVSIIDVIDACRRVLAAKADTASVQLVLDLAPGLQRVRADELRLKQILLNLLSNAVKFTPAGGKVTVTASTASAGMVITVADTGIGMEAADIPVALEPFRQIDGALSRSYEGTGLGLPLAKRLAELHGGWLQIESAPKQGTTVRLHLPAERMIEHAA